MPTAVATNVDRAELGSSILRHARYSLGMTPDRLTAPDDFQALALSVRDRLTDRLLATEARYRAAAAKRLYYLSMEFLIGRSLLNNLANLGLLDEARAAMKSLGVDLESWL